MADQGSSTYIDQLRFLLLAGNVREALQLLNLQSRLRFTALYRLGPTHAQNFIMVDRDDARAPLMDDIPHDATYCQLVEAMKAELVIPDALSEPGLADHPSRELVQAYCGVPLLDESGNVFGTLCQFDLLPSEIDATTLELMHEVAGALGPRALVDAHLRHLQQQADRLSDMQSLIASASDDVESARAAFAEYATPMLHDATKKLALEEELAFEARISAIWQQIETEVRSRAPLPSAAHG
ncbi:MAG: GAF domain-containing protein [Luteimonas sp.]